MRRFVLKHPSSIFNQYQPWVNQDSRVVSYPFTVDSSSTARINHDSSFNSKIGHRCFPVVGGPLWCEWAHSIGMVALMSGLDPTKHQLGPFPVCPWFGYPQPATNRFFVRQTTVILSHFGAPNWWIKMQFIGFWLRFLSPSHGRSLSINAMCPIYRWLLLITHHFWQLQL